MKKGYRCLQRFRSEAAERILTSMCAFVATCAMLCAQQPRVTWDATSLMMDGRRVMPVMGEIHYSRVPADEWQSELRKMKAGGVTIVANYVFWNHVEEEEGVFDWSGQRSLRSFLECCKEEGLPVVLRIGPFCHGEARNGGIPDWMFAKTVAGKNPGDAPRKIRMRSEEPAFLHAVEQLYRQIFTQVQGLQWKDGGPVVACQFDNEYRGHGSYLIALKRIAQRIGFDLPFYTRTGWPALSSPVPYGEMIPLFGDYADGFWDRSIQETAGDYWMAFNFKPFRSSTAIASEQFQYSTESTASDDNTNYPYFTCELGGGMMTSYHRRVYLYPEDAYSLAVVKLGSGSNLLGYYMYHGGTNPDSRTGIYLNETQRTLATNYNDLPVKSYDFQAPIGEFGQLNPHYYSLRKLHLFMQDYGDVLAPMESHFPQAAQPQKKGIDTYLRWAYRSAPSRSGKAGEESAFVFINNYERLQNLSEKRGVELDVCGVRFPRINIPAGTVCILPVNIDGIRYATAQIIAKRDGKIYMEQLPGIPTQMAVDGKVLKNLKPQGLRRPVYRNIYLLTPLQAEHLFLDEKNDQLSTVNCQFEKVREAGQPRTITIGVNKVAEEPTDEDFNSAAVYRIDLPDVPRQYLLLNIDYRGDVARLYADGKVIDDNFYNGRTFQYALWRLPSSCRQLELRILPLQKDMPVYFPHEADTTPGEKINGINLIKQ